ncbi:hypothetical protein Cme02nite_08200 [Catellatospora methionotrophica]|uniref:Uncharacterized protein n=1 Tax=Catellatospora methionotrophica TaxID=121620 RepID=A0A8J3L173_9ACTN|nr:hypothetical protein [Catellatospora methionotrophica]GIG12488.1 hypothetical protein Cme02nite_08200 [Catellatospora methionotrophica]
MTLVSCLVVTLIVWTISLIRSVRLRAVVYSLPIPMTLVLLATPTVVDGAQLLGVVALNLFFVVVAVAHHRFGWPILVADAVGVATYVALGASIAAVAPWPLAPTLVAVVLGWIAVNAVLARRPGDDAPARPDLRPAAVKLAIAFGGSVLTIALGGVLHGLVVTFPYAGVLVAVESRADLPQFCRHFAYSCLGMIAFVATFAVAQTSSRAAALALAWAAYAVCAGLLLVLRAAGARVARRRP